MDEKWKEKYFEREEKAIRKREKDIPLKKSIKREYLIFCILFIIVASIVESYGNEILVIEGIYDSDIDKVDSILKISFQCTFLFLIIFPIIMLFIKKKKIKDLNGFNKYLSIFLILLPSILSLIIIFLLFIM